MDDIRTKGGAPINDREKFTAEEAEADAADASARKGPVGDAAAMEVAAAIVDLEIEPAKAADRAAGCMLTLGVGEANREYRGLQGRLNEKSDEEQRAALRAFMETKAKARVNPRGLPGR